MSNDAILDGEGTEDPGPIAAPLPSSERGYIIPAQDGKGHHIRLYCRAMPAVGRMVADLHASRKYPFRTMGDLVRWCIVDGTKRLMAGAGVQSVTAQADAMIAVLQDEEFQIHFMEFFNYLKRVTDHYSEAGAPGEARRVVALARAQIQGMPAGFWQQRYQGELLKRYDKLLQAIDDQGSWDPDAAESTPLALHAK
jgi:hypothetical protein